MWNCDKLKEWIFIRSKDEEILVDESSGIGFDSNGVPTQDGLSEVVGKLKSQVVVS